MSEAGHCSRSCGSRPTPPRRPPSSGWYARRPTASSAASTCSPSPRAMASTRSGRSPPSCTRRGSACSSCRGTCSAPAAAACSTPTATLKTVDREEYALRALRRGLRADARRDGRGHLHRQPAGAPDRGARSRTRCRSGNTSARSSGARASTCPRTTRTSDCSRRSSLEPSSCRRARRRSCRCSCRPSSSSCSIR